MSYRVERALSGRAVCVETDCKRHGVKIDKDELRFGVWVEFQESGSFRWKHWGCISGKQLQGVRSLLDPDGTGNYEWDRLDGYDSGDKGSLDGYSDLQDKVRRVITQGFIDPEDFNGDPEMNKLGESGIRSAATKKQLREDERSRKHEIDELTAKVAAAEAERDALKDSAKKTLKKRAKEEDSDGEESKPAPKKRATKAKKEELSSDGELAEVKPAPKKRATKIKKEELASDGELAEVKPAPKKRATKVKKEELASDGEPAEVKPAPKKRTTKVKKEEVGSDGEPIELKPKTKTSRRSAVKEEVINEQNDVGDAPEVKPKAPARKGRKKAVKEEAIDEENGVGDAPEIAIKPKPAAKNRKKAAKKEEPEVEAVVKDEVKGEPVKGSSPLSDITPSALKDEDTHITEPDVATEEKAEVEDSQPKKKGAKAKNAKTPAPKSQVTFSESCMTNHSFVSSTSTRASRSRIASKNESQ